MSAPVEESSQPVAGKLQHPDEHDQHGDHGDDDIRLKLVIAVADCKVAQPAGAEPIPAGMTASSVWLAEKLIGSFQPRPADI
jgi:hypothetical protein